MFIIGVVTSLSIGGINTLMRRIFSIGKKDKKDKPHWAIEWATESLASAFSYVYFIGDITSSVMSKIKYGTFVGWGYNNPLMSFLDTGTDAISESFRTIMQYISKEEYQSGDKEGELKWRESATNLLRHTFQVTGTINSINAAEIMRWLDLGWRVYEGELGEEGLSAEEIREKYGIGGATPSSSKETTTGLSAQEIREKYNIK